MERIVLAWYGWLSGLTQASVLGLGDWVDRLQLPLATAVLFGMIGALAPCQLTTNLGALAYASAHPGRGRPFTLALAYVAGKVSVYTVVGALVILAGLRLETFSIPVVLVARKLLGPLMIAVGVGLLGLVNLRARVGQQLAFRLRRRLDARGLTGAYLLGVAFSVAFCPTLFWLFFGLTIPLALRSAGGWVFAGLFALGSSLPVLVVTGAVAVGIGAVEQIAGGMRHVERPLRAAAGAVLVLAGLHDTIVYWLL